MRTPLPSPLLCAACQRGVTVALPTDDCTKGDLAIFRRQLPGGSEGYDLDGYKSVHLDHKSAANGGFWGGEELHHLCPARDAVEIPVADFEAVRRATQAGLPMVMQTEIAGTGEGSGLRAVIEYPVKTMNLAIDASAVPADGDEPTPPAEIWQTDTGVVLVPDLSRRWGNPIEGMSLGYIAANNRGKQTHAADFVLEQPTPIGGGREVLHFSAPFSLPATNRLFALPRPG